MIGGWLSSVVSMREDQLADWLPWIEPAAPDIMLTSSGGLLRCASIQPPDLETASFSQIDRHYRALTALQSRMGTGWTVMWDLWRHYDPGYLPESDFGGNLAAQAVDRGRRRQFEEQGAVLTDRIYVSLHWNPQASDAMIRLMHDHHVNSEAEILRDFRDQTNEVFQGLALQCPSVRIMVDEGLGTYLQEAVTYQHIETALPDTLVSHHYGRLADWGHDGRSMKIDDLYVATAEVHVFGAFQLQALDFMHETPHPLRWTTTMHCMDPEDQKHMLTRLRKSWTPKERGIGGWLLVGITKDKSRVEPKPEIQRVMAEIEDMRYGLMTTSDGLGQIATTIRTWDTEQKVADDRLYNLIGKLNAAGLRSRKATLNQVPVALAEVPGQVAKDLRHKRKIYQPVSKIVAVSPVTSLTIGYREDEHLKGPALLVAQSRRRGPLFVSLHAPGSDRGHFVVIGPSGGGKSTLLSLIVQSHQRYLHSTATIFDVHRSSMVSILCSDGTHLEFGEGGAGVQPLRFIDSDRGAAWATSWLQAALELRQIKTNAEVDAALREAISALRQEKDPDEYTLSNLCAHLGAHPDVRRALEHYTVRGPLRGLLDRAVPGYGSARILGFELENVIELAELPLILAACFNQLWHERIPGSHPKLILVDEAFVPLRHPLFRQQIETLARTGRKKNVQLGLFTQDTADVKGAETLVTLHQIPTRIFTADERAEHEANANLLAGIGLTAEHIQTIASLQPKREYLIQTMGWTRVADLTLRDEPLKICAASSEADIRRARAIRDEIGLSPPPGAFLERWLAA